MERSDGLKSWVLVIAEATATAECFAKELAGVGLLTETVVGFSQAVRPTGTDNFAGVVIAASSFRPEVLQTIREYRAVSEQIFLVGIVASRTDSEEVAALEAGLDQSFLSPITSTVFRTRVQALLARYRALRPAAEAGSDIRRLGELQIDLNFGRISCHGKAVDLTPTERNLIELLTRSPGRPVTRTSIAYSLWGWDGDTYEEHIKCHVSRMRAKIRSICGRGVIQTVRGRGYCVVSDSTGR